MAITNITNAPATAKDEISTPQSDKTRSPTNQNNNNIAKEEKAALPAFIGPDFSFRSMSIGVNPVISIIAKSTINALNASWKLKTKSICKQILIKSLC